LETFHRYHTGLIDASFRPRIPIPARPATDTELSGQDERREAHLSRLRQENADLRRTLAPYEEVIRQLTLENDALRQGATVVPLPVYSRPSPP
jgi:hypothetical protein